MPNFFDKKYVIHYWNLQFYLRLGLKLNNTSCIRVQSITMVKTIYWIQHTRKNKSRKKWRQRWTEALYKLMNNATYRKAMENVRSRINLRLINKEIGYWKWTSKPSSISNQRFDNNLVAIHKVKVELKFNKPEYIGMCFELRKILIRTFHYDYIKNKYNKKSKTIFHRHQ